MQHVTYSIMYCIQVTICWNRNPQCNNCIVAHHGMSIYLMHQYTDIWLKCIQKLNLPCTHITSLNISSTNVLMLSVEFFTGFIVHYVCNVCLPSVLWRCWLGGRKGIQPVKNWVVGCWRGYLGWGADLHMAQQMPLQLTISCSSKSRLVLPFLVLPFWYLLTWLVPTNSRRAVKRLCACVCNVCVCLQTLHVLIQFLSFKAMQGY